MYRLQRRRCWRRERCGVMCVSAYWNDDGDDDDGEEGPPNVRRMAWRTWMRKVQALWSSRERPCARLDRNATGASRKRDAGCTGKQGVFVCWMAECGERRFVGGCGDGGNKEEEIERWEGGKEYTAVGW